MLSGKATSEQLDENNQKRLQKIVGKFLYYARAIEPTMLMEIKSLEAVQKKPTIETEKQITQFLSYSATHSDIVTEYRRSGIILRIYLDTSHISEPESQSISGEYFYLEKKPTHRYKPCPREIYQCVYNAA